jgi:REP element-mobilizing transposase RayT
MWVRGYFCCTSGNVTDEIVKKYIENQNITDEETEFKVD